MTTQRSSIKQAIYCSNYGVFGDPRALVRVAQAAEAAGWDGFFLYDHILWSPGEAIDSADPWVSLGAIAQATSRLTLGPMVTPVARRQPWELAHQVIALDHLSGGNRLILGVGLGVEREYVAFGNEEPATVRAAHLDEGLEILAQLWSGETVEHTGHWQLRGVRMRPRPIAPIPIWVAGRYPNRRPARRAARHDGVIPINTVWSLDDLLPPAALGEIGEMVRADRSDMDGFDVVNIGVSPSEPIAAAQHIAAYAEEGATWWLELLSPMEQELSLEDCLARVAAGPPVI
jgi:alkanesulfonate monooxygenase SsuD/methylene tetrahydromethanopterin reductase-like flavin-dependent oxidoreductase (luciferase family)